ncbi:MAG: electron transfer flavoprotein subunit beta/FixA family protein [Deltaproteobacteria bacterium]|nr:electron transfer flavoprotein subunit beta/FixA family protein [Deltaproteobacteria bacterium]
MRVAVCVKSVVSKEPKNVKGPFVPRSPDQCVLNPFDRPAVGLARELAGETGEVCAVSMGPQTAMGALREALALGADRGVLLCDPALAGSDTLATSRALAAAAKRLSPLDLVVFGTRSADSDTGHVPPQTAVLLGLPLVSWVVSAKISQGVLSALRAADGFEEKVRAPLPAVVTVHPKVPAPEEPGLADLDAAFDKKPLTCWDLAALGVSPGQAGQAGSPTTVLSMARTKAGRSCELLEGSGRDQARELVRRLKDKGLL